MEEDIAQTTCKKSMEAPATDSMEMKSYDVDENQIPSTSKAWSNRHLKSQSEETMRTPSSEAMSVASQPVEVDEAKSNKQLQNLGQKLRSSRKKKRGVKRAGKKGRRGRPPVRRYGAAKKRASGYRKPRRSGSDLVSERSSRETTYSRDDDSCKVCGHRICARRRNKIRKNKKRKKQASPELSESGSATNQTSPLCIKTCPVPQLAPEEPCYCEINPHMLHQALRTLSKWREIVTIEDLAVFIANHYPVNPNDTELLIELLEKLRIAELCKTVVRVSMDGWRLPGHLENRRLSNTHVSQFWQLYIDTIKPIQRPVIPIKLMSETGQQSEVQPDYIA